MEDKIKTYLGIAFIAALFLAVVAGFWYVNSFSESVKPERVFQVSGEGKVIAAPEVAELSLGVLTEGGKDLADLQKENTQKINRIIAFLKEKGIEEKDIQTQFYNISPRYQYFSCLLPLGREAAPCPPSEIIGYSINQNVLVKIRDLNKAGDIVAGVVDKGANTVSNLIFTIDNPTRLQNQAREKAITQAKEQAEAIAKAADFKLGNLISIQEGFVSPLPGWEASGYGKGGGGDISSPSIEPGSQEVRVSVSLVYEMR
jgi:uncharacterized protein